MTPTKTEVVERFLDMPFGQLSTAYELLDEDVVIQTSFGHVYTGHDGWTEWFKLAAAHHRDWTFETHEIRWLENDYVLIRGTSRRESSEGETIVQPGAWIFQVHEGRIVCLLFFRTEAEALGSLGECK